MKPGIEDLRSKLQTSFEGAPRKEEVSNALLTSIIPVENLIAYDIVVPSELVFTNHNFSSQVYFVQTLNHYLKCDHCSWKNYNLKNCN